MSRIVIAGGAVGAQAYRHPGGEILRHRSNATRQLHIALPGLCDTATWWLRSSSDMSAAFTQTP